ncbi:MAG: M protein [Mycobacteriaceae bacterium]|nr:M protein [Mycobacteriaceae bacterium]
MSLSDSHWSGRKRSFSFEVERLSCHIDAQDQQLKDLRSLVRREDSRIATLSEQLHRSQADLELTASRFNALAGEIPADIADLSDQLSAILNAATAEAEEIRAEARQFAESIRIEAEERAAVVLTEAELEHRSAAELRASVEAQSKQIRVDIAELRQQATLNAAEIVRDAENQVEEMLTRAHRDVNAQLAAAQAKLDELSSVRANIVAQLKDFYEQFTALDRSVETDRRVSSICVVPSVSAHKRSAHSAHDVVMMHETLGDVG